MKQSNILFGAFALAIGIWSILALSQQPWSTLAAPVEDFFVGYFAWLEDNGSDLERVYGWQDTDGLVYWKDLKSGTYSVSLWPVTKNCTKQIRGIYINTARGNVIRPLDEDTLVALQAIDDSYDAMAIDGWLYTSCDNNTSYIYGQVNHSFDSLDHVLIAWVDVDTDENNYNYAFDTSLQFFNNTTQGYLIDGVNGVANVNWFWLSITTPTPTPDNDVVSSTGQTIVGTGPVGSQVEIVTSAGTFTGVVWEDWYYEITVILAEWVNELLITFTDDDDLTIGSTTLTITVTLPDDGWDDDEDEDDDDTPKPKSKPPVVQTDIEKWICELDCSPSYYDGKCGTCTQSQHNAAQQSSWDQDADDPIMDTLFYEQVADIMEATNGAYDEELVEAYVFARKLGMTTMMDISQAELYTPLPRKQLAKFLTEFTTKLLSRVPNMNEICVFSDVSQESQEMQNYMTMSCKLNVMGMQPNGEDPDVLFNPNRIVTRAEFATAMSRVIYNNAIRGTEACFYCNHLEQLRKDNIVTKVDVPFQEELRWHVMLMMYRAYQQLRK